MGRWLAGRLMKELELVSCQQPTRRCSRPVRKKTSGLGNVVLAGQQTHYESAGKGLGNAW